MSPIKLQLTANDGTIMALVKIDSDKLANVQCVEHHGKTYSYAGFMGTGYRTVEFREIANTVTLESLLEKTPS